MPSKDIGSVHVYTGDGKGKTTAAFGLAMRASGKGLSVLIVQFMKGRPDCGEIVSAKRLPKVRVEQYGTEELVVPGRISEEDRRLARKALARARDAMKKKEAEMLILDEINVAVHFGLVTVEEIVDLVKARPPSMELVLTGRYAGQEVIELADYITEMKAKKHPFDSGKKPRHGIEC